MIKPSFSKSLPEATVLSITLEITSKVVLVVRLKPSSSFRTAEDISYPRPSPGLLQRFSCQATTPSDIRTTGSLIFPSEGNVSPKFHPSVFKYESGFDHLVSSVALVLRVIIAWSPLWMGRYCSAESVPRYPRTLSAPMERT